MLLPTPPVDGREVEVLEGRARRGGSELTVRLPDGVPARLRIATVATHASLPATVNVRLDPDGCVVLPVAQQ